MQWVLLGVNLTHPYFLEIILTYILKTKYLLKIIKSGIFLKKKTEFVS